MALPRKEEKTYSWTLQHNSPPKHNDDPSSEHIFGLQIEKRVTKSKCDSDILL